MSTRVVLPLLLAVLAACGGERRPDVVLITLDTTRADALSCLGGDPRTTPHLDALGASGALFTHARSETNVTNPSHVSILTGRRAIDHGVMNNVTPLPDGVGTLPEALRAAGWRTGGFVATEHLAGAMGWRGFDAFPDVDGELTADEVTERALAWLDADDAPAFLWVHYFDPHTWYVPPPEDAALFYDGDPTAGDGTPVLDYEYFRRIDARPFADWLAGVRDPAWAPAMYAAELHAADRAIGRLLERVGDDAIVLVVGDHGESLGEHGIYYAHKGLAEVNLRVPLIVRAPGLAPVVSDAPVSTLDVAPTLAELAGVALPAPAAGGSLVPALSGGPAPVPEVAVHQNAANRVVAVRRGDWKLVIPIDREHAILAGPPRLYDLASDPDERDDRAARSPERVAELRGFARPWLDLGVVVPGETPHLDADALRRLEELGYAGGG